MTPAAVLLDTWNGLLDLLYPPKCLVCGAFGPDVLCGECRAGFAAITGPVCARCGAVVGETSPPDPLSFARRGGAAGALCETCAAGRHYYFAAARAAGLFDGRLREAILRLKYREKRRLAVPLGAFLAEFLQTAPFANTEHPTPNTFDLLVPVPLHPARQRERGFNQSALIAREAGRRLGLPVCETALRRVRRTRPQVELRPAERAANVRDAFAIRDTESVQGKRVLLLDDVLTTLHTSNEVSRVLVNAGAAVVYVAAVARGG